MSTQSVIASMGGFVVTPTDTSTDLGKLLSNFDQVLLPALANTNSANQLVRLDDGGRLPAVDGSQLSNLPASNPFNQSLCTTDGVQFSCITTGGIYGGPLADDSNQPSLDWSNRQAAANVPYAPGLPADGSLPIEGITAFGAPDSSGCNNMTWQGGGVYAGDGGDMFSYVSPGCWDFFDVVGGAHYPITPVAGQGIEGWSGWPYGPPFEAAGRGTCNVPTFDWSAAQARDTFVVYGSGSSCGRLSLDWNQRQAVDSSSVVSLDWNQRWAVDSYGVTSLDWNQRQAADTNCMPSLSWQQRQAMDSGGRASLDWNARQLLGADGAEIVLDWGSHLAEVAAPYAAGLPADGSQPIEGITLFSVNSPGGGYGMSWAGNLYVGNSGGVFGYCSPGCWDFFDAVANVHYPITQVAGQGIEGWSGWPCSAPYNIVGRGGTCNVPTLDWSAAQARDTFVVYGSGSTCGRLSLDWNQRQAVDTNGQPSLDWGGRQLLDSTGAPVLDWSNPNCLRVYDGSGWQPGCTLNTNMCGIFFCIVNGLVIDIHN